jgi:GNAT superfamily N-acetyltransferase
MAICLTLWPNEWMHSALRIKPGTHAEVPQIASLMQKYWSVEGIAGFEAARSAQLLGRLIGQTHLGSIWVAYDGDELVGYLIAVFVLSFEYQGLVAEIDELFVLPQVRRHGVGAALLDAAEVSVAAAGCTCVQLQLGTGNRHARAFYHRQGYSARSGYELFGKRLGESPRGQGAR